MRASVRLTVCFVAIVATSAAAQSVERNVIYGMVSGTALLLDVYRLAALTAQGGDAQDPDPVSRHSTKLRAVAVVAAPTDLMAGDAAGGGAIGAFMRMRPPVANATEASTSVRLYREASPITHISADDPPLLLVHGDADQSVAIRQSVAFHAAAQKAGVRSKLVVLPGGEHGATFGLAHGSSRPSNWPDYIGEIVAWFDQHAAQ